jgi:uncharacterized protein (TIGR01777 family)
MNILITGATGLVGEATATALTASGHHVVPLRRPRDRAAPRPPFWNPEANLVDLTNAGPLDAVVHLAGESIAQRWTPAARERIRDSRVQGTRLLCDALTKLAVPPRVMISASATGFYGHHGDAVLEEESATGTGFLAEVCRAWEAATDSLSERGVRVAHLRTGIVLDARGGALGRMLTPFRLGLGGRLGNGNQFWSWIELNDLVRAIQHILATDSLSGPVNAVSPQPVTNREFTVTLGRVLRRPTALAVPEWAVKLLFGEMGREAMLASARVLPRRLLHSGFIFQEATLEGALRHMLNC